jgi:hypothetical protein
VLVKGGACLRLVILKFRFGPLHRLIGITGLLDCRCVPCPGRAQLRQFGLQSTEACMSPLALQADLVHCRPFISDVPESDVRPGFPVLTSARFEVPCEGRRKEFPVAKGRAIDDGPTSST